ncbi:MAG: PIN domain-containing protein [Candidatus Dependentiae bacterium]|nr:PIN domain-containing protein [Candidatus Dependentiae bacterium]
MKNKIFLDSNILIYLYSADELNKIHIIQNILDKYESIIISTQVLFEFSFVMHRKLKLDYNDIKKSLEEFHTAFDIVIINYDTLQNALKIASKYNYSFPDSLIIATALEYNCNILFSEDMHNDQIIDNNLKILNPFK